MIGASVVELGSVASTEEQQLTYVHPNTDIFNVNSTLISSTITIHSLQTTYIVICENVIIQILCKPYFTSESLLELNILLTIGYGALNLNCFDHWALFGICLANNVIVETRVGGRNEARQHVVQKCSDSIMKCLQALHAVQGE